MDTYFVVTAPGLEILAAQELGALLGEGVLAPEPGGVTFKGDLSALYRANLHLRTASRILARLGAWFYATTFEELEQRAARLPWERFITPGQAVAIRVTCHKSRLYHSDAVARSVLAALAERLGQPSPVLKSDEESDQVPQLVVVRMADDKCTVSVDSSGVVLHKRGYRLAGAKAPLRETLAAAMLMASSWDRVSALVDPFCGSGTIPIEGALMALHIPPGLHRRFAFMDWPNSDPALWQALCAQAQPLPGRPLPIFGADRDAGAIEMARANADRAGVGEWLTFACQPVSEAAQLPGPGWVVTNPPYGLRVGGAHDLRNLYAQFGNVLRAHYPHWKVAVLCNEERLAGQMRIKLDASLALVNGGVGVRLNQGVVEP